jgi:hypothetical protein
MNKRSRSHSYKPLKTGELIGVTSQMKSNKEKLNLRRKAEKRIKVSTCN